MKSQREKLNSSKQDREGETPYDTHQPTLMSPRYSNVTTSIRELIVYMICIEQFQIHNTQSNTKNPKECPKIFTGETKDENMHQPLCIDYPNVTSGIRELSVKTHIK